MYILPQNLPISESQEMIKLTGLSEVRQIIIKGKVLYFNKMFNNWTSSQKRFHRTDLLQYKSVK